MSMSTEMSSYYMTNFSHCTNDAGILAREESVSSIAHVLTVFAFPLNFISLYCIVFKSPEKMKSMKWSLLYFQSMCAFNDVLFTLFMCPFIFYPFCAGYTIGLLNNLNFPITLQFCLGAGVITSTGLAVTVVLESQHKKLVRNSVFNKPWIRGVYIAADMFMAYILLIPMIFLVPEQNMARMEILKKIPCPAKEFFENPIFVLAIDNFAMAVFMTFITTFACTFAGYFTLHSIYELTRFRVDISALTRTLHRKYFVKVCIQLAIPLFIMIFPLFYLVISMRNDYYNQAANNICVLLILFHGVIATTATILTFGPYRRFALKVFSLGYIRLDKPKRIPKVSVVF